MSYPKQLLKLRPSRGLALDVPAQEVSAEFWTGGSNIRPRDGVIERAPGSLAVYAQSTTDPVYRLLNVRAPGGVTASNFWLVFGGAEIQALETSNITAVTGSALNAVTEPWRWSATLLNNTPCFSNSLDAPRYWGGDVGVAAVDLPNWPANYLCKSLVAFKFHLFALDIETSSAHLESQILWSSAAAAGTVPATWVAAATNDAGSATLADTPGPCMCGVPLQDTLLVFKRSSVYGVNYIEGRSFSVQLLDAVRGSLTRHSAINVGGKVLVVTDGDIMLTDGVNWQSIASSLVRRYLFSQLEQSSYENLFAVYDRANEEAWICYPTAGSTFCDEALVYNFSVGAWGVRPLTDVTCARVGIINDTAADESWDADSEAWDDDASAWNSANYSLANEQLVMAGDSATLTLKDSETAVAIAATVSKHDMTFDAPERFKFVKRVHVRTNTTPGLLYIRVGVRNSVTDSISWGSEQTLTTPEAYVNVSAMGRFVSVQIRSEDSDVWKVAGLDMEYELRGYV